MPATRRTAEQIFRGLLRAPLYLKTQSAANQFAGVTTLPSGAASVVVSTTLVGSDSLIFAQVMAPAPAGSVGLVVHVSTISPGNFFTLATADAQNAPRSLPVAFLVYKAS